jgi:hypothetical protein
MTDAEWNATLREGERQARIAAALAYLVRCEGAVLYWQVPQELQQGMQDALDDGRIAFAEDSDCLVHPDAVRVTAEGGDCWAGWHMPR